METIEIVFLLATIVGAVYIVLDALFDRQEINYVYQRTIIRFVPKLSRFGNSCENGKTKTFRKDIPK